MPSRSSSRTSRRSTKTTSSRPSRRRASSRLIVRMRDLASSTICRKPLRGCLIAPVLLSSRPLHILDSESRPCTPPPDLLAPPPSAPAVLPPATVRGGGRGRLPTSAGLEGRRDVARRAGEQLAHGLLGVLGRALPNGHDDRPVLGQGVLVGLARVAAEPEGREQRRPDGG